MYILELFGCITLSSFWMLIVIFSPTILNGWTSLETRVLYYVPYCKEMMMFSFEQANKAR